MDREVALTALTDLTIGEDRSVVLKARAPDGELSIKLGPGLTQSLAPALLNAAAIDVAPNRLTPGSSVPAEVHIPIMAWHTGNSRMNDQPILVLESSGARPLVFQMSAKFARECGAALIQAAEVAAAKANPA